jgi:hypothetical protein
MTTATCMPCDASITTYPLLAQLAAGRPLADVEITVALERPSFHGRSEFQIRPGVIDADAIELFGFSQCIPLAHAMHDATGWSFTLVEQFVDGVWKWAHVGVLTPAGRMLDIHGRREVFEVERQMAVDFNIPARVRVLPTPEALAAVISPGASARDWRFDITTPVGVEVVAVLADLLTSQTREAEGVAW